MAQSPSSRGRTALSYAAIAGSVDIVRALVDRGDLEAVDSLRRTALMLASMGGHTEVVQVLVAAGANLDATDVDGRTAFALAEHTDRDQIMEMLAEAHFVGML